MAWGKNRKRINQLIDEYFFSSKLHDYYELPYVSSYNKLIENSVDTEDDYFLVKMNATPALKEDRKSINGIQQRIIKAVRNSFIGHCFAGYDMKDTFISINPVSENYSSNIFNLKGLEQHLDKTSCRTVRLFSGRLPNGYYKLAAKLEEKGAVLYVHKSALFLPAIELLAPFIQSESDRGWLVDYMQKIIDEKPKVHF